MEAVFILSLSILSLLTICIFVICYLFLPPMGNGTEFMVVPVNLLTTNDIHENILYYAVRWKRRWMWHYFYDIIPSKKSKINDTHIVLFTEQKDAYQYINDKYSKSKIVWKD